MASRQRSAIPIPTAVRVARVPDSAAPSPLFRVCDRRHASPWYFSSGAGTSDGGRFDLLPPHGTSYWADSALGALFERLVDPDAPDTAAPASLLARLTVWQYLAAEPISIADATAARGGLPKEIGANTDYRPAWSWAAALHANDRAGVQTWSRMAPHGTKSVAIFGPAGSRPLRGGESAHDALAWHDELIDLGLIEPDPPRSAYPTRHPACRRLQVVDDDKCRQANGVVDGRTNDLQGCVGARH